MPDALHRCHVPGRLGIRRCPGGPDQRQARGFQAVREPGVQDRVPEFLFLGLVVHDRGSTEIDVHDEFFGLDNDTLTAGSERISRALLQSSKVKNHRSPSNSTS